MGRPVTDSDTSANSHSQRELASRKRQTALYLACRRADVNGTCIAQPTGLFHFPPNEDDDTIIILQPPTCCMALWPLPSLLTQASAMSCFCSSQSLFLSEYPKAGEGEITSLSFFP